MTFPRYGGDMASWARALAGYALELEARLAALESRPEGGNLLPITDPTTIMPLPWAVSDISANLTWDRADLNLCRIFNCTSACAITFPTPGEGDWVWVFNYGAAALTLKTDGGTAMCVLAQNQGAMIEVMTDTSGAPKWPTGVAAASLAGDIYPPANIVFAAGKGPTRSSPAGQYWMDDGTTAAIAGLAPTGGSTGQVLVKNSATNYDYSWTTKPAPTPAYLTSNVTTDRTFDANATTLDELADVVGTIIADLQANGVMS